MFICVTTECLPEREHTVTAVIGSAVSFNCTLGVNFSTRRARWLHHSPSYGPVMGFKFWYYGGKINPSLDSRGVTVENNPTRGWSVLTIPRVRLADRGRFRCYVVDLAQYQVDFQLSVTGNNYIICCNMYVIMQITLMIPTSYSYIYANLKLQFRYDR